MIGENRPAPRFPDGFRQEVLTRITHWARFPGTEEEKLAMVAADAEWTRLVEVEVGLEPVSDQSRAIRRCIAGLEPCHEHYLENVLSILEMVGPLQPCRVLGCGEVCDARRRQVHLYHQSLGRWLEGRAPAAAEEDCDREVTTLLGARTPEKAGLVEHLVRKLADSRYSVYPDEAEDFQRVESRIQHLQPCNYHWPENLRIVLQEIAAGERLFSWHTPDGYNAHGDCPDRVSELRDPMCALSAWAEGAAPTATTWTQGLGDVTPEKRWLIASLCKHVSAQHAPHGGDRLLPRPSL